MNKSRIGILTMHRVQNYGSALQAYALQEYITQLGYDAELIDYLFPNGKHKQHRSLKKVIKSTLFRWIFSLPILRKNKRFIRFYSDYYKCSELRFDTPQGLMQYDYPYDILITGSDQVWNPIHILTDTSFFLPFARPHTPKIAYAPSFSVSSIPEGFDSIIRPYIETYSYISVREKSGLDIMKTLTAKEASMVCDPTLLLTKADWSTLAAQSEIQFNEPYILVYILSYAYNPYPAINTIIEKVQQELDMPLILLDAPILDMKFKNARFIKDAGPAEFLYLVQHASFIITTSFHGTAFAVNFGIPFYSVIRDRSGFDTRMVDFLETVDADRAIVYDRPIDKPIAMNFERIEKRLEDIRHHSQTYIKKSIEYCLQSSTPKI